MVPPVGPGVVAARPGARRGVRRAWWLVPLALVALAVVLWVTGASTGQVTPWMHEQPVEVTQRAAPAQLGAALAVALAVGLTVGVAGRRRGAGRDDGGAGDVVPEAEPGAPS